MRVFITTILSTLMLVALGVSASAQLATNKSYKLQLIQAEAKGSRSTYADFGLSGHNKRNGMVYRLRQTKLSPQPAFMADALSGMKLFLSERSGDKFLALYRTPMSAKRDWFTAAVYSAEGKRLHELDLNALFSSKHNLEVQDIRLNRNMLYFNGACPSYSSQSKGRCSRLYAYDLLRHKLLWKTPYLTSNNIFILSGDLIIAGYGFTDEKDYLYLIDRHSGEIHDKVLLDSAHEYLEIRDGVLHVITYSKYYRFRIAER